jgi:nucleoside-diphosphate-sugar epimerase
MVQTRVGTTIGSGRNELALVYAGNVAEGVVLALTNTGSGCRAYNLTNDFPLTQRDLFRLAAAILGRRRVILPVPGFVARALVRESSPVRARGLAFLALRNPFVSDLARREFGWTPRTRHDVGLSRAIQWHLAHAGNVPQ